MWEGSSNLGYWSSWQDSEATPRPVTSLDTMTAKWPPEEGLGLSQCLVLSWETEEEMKPPPVLPESGL